MGFSREILVAVLLVSVVAQLVEKAVSVTYVVGDSMGWTIPSSPGAYATYASQHVFVVGDVLVFNFTNGVHDVARVSSSGCSSTNPIALATISPASFTLNSTGPDYYICTFGQHCSLGQSLSINVVAASTPPTTTTPAPPPSIMAPPPSTVTPPSSGMTPPPSTATPPSSGMTPPPSTVTPPSSGMTPSSAPTSPPSSSMAPPTITPSPSSSTPSMAPNSPTMSPFGAPGAAPTMTPFGAPGPAPSNGMTPSLPMAPSSPGSSPAGPSADGSGSVRAMLCAPLAILGSIVIGLMI